MKSIKLLFIFLFACLLVLPFNIYAEGEEENTETKEEVNFYFFRGEGCSHCAEAEEWLKSIEEEHGSKFKVVDYETWYSEENAELMQQVAEARGEEASGVPYIIIGNQSWNGFTTDYGNEMISKINSEYEKDVNDRYDIMKLMKTIKKDTKKSSNDIIPLLIIIIIISIISFGIYKARKSIN